ncbi:carbohydrate ABC transporter permease [Halegenticoccus tardaugens]|uniref:carbohydrate ABC transporter permease n=1 Tax=Halegenticoccus tardaugens TaxID=2071624 RepID=UPI00100C06EA|nr:carbohydrate ABC transporter permease [Halegenticoccus tardaugens]
MSVRTHFTTRLDDDVTARRALVVYALLFLYYGFFFVPILWLVSSSLKADAILFSSDLVLLPPPEHFTLANYQRVLSDRLFQGYFLNSTAVAVQTTVLTLLCGVPAAYAVSRFDFPGRDYVVVGFLSSQMLPLVLVLIPFFTVMFRLRLIDTLLGLVLAHTVVSLPFVIWLLKGFFDGIPQSLDDAAMMDGCSRIQIMYRIIIPLSLPGIAVAGFYAFLASWNDFLFVSVLSQSDATRTLPFGLQLFQSANQVDWGAVTAAATLTMIPVVLLFALVHRWLVEGLTTSGMKGS